MLLPRHAPHLHGHHERSTACVHYVVWLAHLHGHLHALHALHAHLAGVVHLNHLIHHVAALALLHADRNIANDVSIVARLHLGPLPLLHSTPLPAASLLLANPALGRPSLLNPALLATPWLLLWPRRPLHLASTMYTTLRWPRVPPYFLLSGFEPQLQHVQWLKATVDHV